MGDLKGYLRVTRVKADLHDINDKNHCKAALAVIECDCMAFASPQRQM